MDSLGSLIDSCLLRKTKKNYWQIQLITDYSKIVGKAIAGNTKLIFLQGKQATIICRNSIWMNELKTMEPELITKLNQFVGKKVIEGIVVKVGNIEKQKTKVEIKKNRKLSQDEVDWIAQTKLLVPQPLQSRFESVLIAYKELKK